MQSAETVLGVLRERGRRGLPCSELYRQMFNPSLYLLSVDRTTRRHAGAVGALVVRWPVEITRLFRRETRGAGGWVRRAGRRLAPAAAVGPCRCGRGCRAVAGGRSGRRGGRADSAVPAGLRGPRQPARQRSQLGQAAKPRSSPRTGSAATAGTVNEVTRKRYLGDQYEPRTVRHGNAVLRSFYEFWIELGGEAARKRTCNTAGTSPRGPSHRRSTKGRSLRAAASPRPRPTSADVRASDSCDPP